MGCNNCNKGSNGLPRGCNNNGNCASGTCGALTVFDWLADISASSFPFKIVEVRFKNGRKEYFRNNDLVASKGNPIITESEKGYDIGEITLTGELVKNQMKRKGINIEDKFMSLLRYPNEKEINKWQAMIKKESEVQIKARQIAIELGLKMKISDVEFQADGSKVIFYYTADGRVDFRELIKRYAREFKIRIEMKQVGLREEASRLGGIGSCGRELCCSTWLTDFRAVSTGAARYQQLSLNPEKLAGQCGKLKCCLNFELDQYMEALKSYPSTKTLLETKEGKANHIKTDVFKRLMYYFISKDGKNSIVPLSVERVFDIIELNKKGEIPHKLTDFVDFVEKEAKPDYTNVVGQDELTRFDKVFKKNKNKSSNNRKANSGNRNKSRNKNFRNKRNNKNKSNKPKSE